MHRATPFFLALGISLFAAGGAHAALTGLCEGTALTGFENRTPLHITDIKVASQENFDFNGTLPTSVPPRGGVLQDNGLIANNFTSWTITQRIGDAKAKISMILLDKTNGQKIPLTLEYFTQDTGGKWKPNTGKLVANVGKLAIGIVKNDTKYIVEGSIYAVSSITQFTELKHGASLRVDLGMINTSFDANRPYDYISERDDREGTFIHIGKPGTGYALVILPVPSNCSHAGWRVALMSYAEYMKLHPTFE